MSGKNFSVIATQWVLDSSASHHMTFNWADDIIISNLIELPSRGVQKKSKPRTEPKNRKNRTEKPVNRTNFSKKSVRLTEPNFFSVFSSVTVRII